MYTHARAISNFTGEKSVTSIFDIEFFVATTVLSTLKIKYIIKRWKKERKIEGLIIKRMRESLNLLFPF